MNWFQIVTLPAIGLVFAYSLKTLWRPRHSRRIALATSLVCLCAATAILHPELTTRVALRLGIGRGADLLLYAHVLVFLMVCFYGYVRLQRLEQSITQLVRELTIQEGLRRWPPPASGEQPSHLLKEGNGT